MTTETARTFYEATCYKLADDGETWDVYKTGTGTSRRGAAKAATAYLPMGYGGHGRSERTLEAIRAGETVATPLGTYRLDVDEVRNYAAGELGFYDTEPGAAAAAAKASELIHKARQTGQVFGEELDPADAATYIAQHVAEMFPLVGANDTVSREAVYFALIGELDAQLEGAGLEAAEIAAGAGELVEGSEGWGVVRESIGLGSRFWIVMGRGAHGPFDTIEAARDELEAETKAHNAPRSNPQPVDGIIDFPAYEGGYAFRSGAVKVGDAVAVTFRPDAEGLARPEPVFGYVHAVTPGGSAVQVDDVERGPVTFAADRAETVAVLPGRIRR